VEAILDLPGFGRERLPVAVGRIHVVSGGPLPRDGGLEVLLHPCGVALEFLPSAAEKGERGLGRRGPLHFGGHDRLRLRQPRQQVLLDRLEVAGGGGCAGRLRLDLKELGPGGRQCFVDPRHGRVDLREIPRGRCQPQAAQPIGHLPPAAGPRRLMADRLQPAGNLPDDVGQPLTILLRPLEPPQRLGAAGAEAGDAGGLLEDGPAVAAGRHQKRVDAALLDDAVGLRRGAGAREQLADVAQPRDLAVDEVLALAAAVHPPHDLHLVGLHRQLAGRVVEDERDLGRIERSSRGRAGEDHVGHLAAAEAAGGLLSEHPLEAIDDVRLSRTIRADNDRDAFGKVEASPVGEALEAEQLECFEPGHEDSSVRGISPAVSVSTASSPGTSPSAASSGEISRSLTAVSSWMPGRPSASVGRASNASRLSRKWPELACWRN
jgi:hypothetical protein